MKSFGLILGSSATGKGTRVNQVIQFLNTKFTPENYIVKDKNNKDFIIGLLYKEIEAVFLGKFVENKQANTVSWSSMDSLWSKFGGTEATVDVIKDIPYNVIAEGYSNMDTFRVRPVHMSSKGCKKFFYQVYSYGLDGFDEYIKRVVGRSGKEPKGTTAFEKETQILRFYPKIVNELNELNLDGYVRDYKFDKDINSIGADWFEFLGLDDLRKEFIDFSDSNKYLKSYSEVKEVNQNNQMTLEDW